MDIPERFDALFKHQQTPNGLRLIHLRTASEGYIAKAKYSPYPVSRQTIAFWRRLVTRIERY